MRKISPIGVRWLEYQCEERGFELRVDYSGRGMYGKECVGIVCSQSELGLAQVMIVAALRLDDEGLNWDDVVEAVMEAPVVAVDSMGLDSIVYWPLVQADLEPDVELTT